MNIAGRRSRLPGGGGATEYCGAAEPPARWWRSHLSGLLEPPRLSTGYLAFSGSNP